jgi:uncharacterized protein (DUF433 family)
MTTQLQYHLEVRENDTEARIIGTNFKARVVASIHLHGGLSIEQVADEFEIEVAQVHAALVYYYDNYEEFEAEYNAPPRFKVDAKEQIAKFKKRMNKE